MEPKLIVALDVNDKKAAKKLLNELSDYVKIFKVGPYLFTRYGPDIIKLVRNYNCEVFLDLKLHDIPNTVSHSIKQMVKLGVFMLTIHTQGGIEMMKRAYRTALYEARKKKKIKPLILGVTILSSFDKKDLQSVGIRRSLKKQVIYLSRLAKRCGLDGVVASAKEAQEIKKAVGPDFIVASAGIRPKGSSVNDQKRIVTPQEAIKNGVDYIIIGRPIIESRHPKKVTEEILKEMNEDETYGAKRS